MKTNNQTIRGVESLNILINLLTDNSIMENNKYIVNNALYRKILLTNRFDNFIADLKPYYHKSKLNYLDECNTYNKFLTIVRHICSYNNVECVKEVVYEKSKYKPVYYISMNSVDI